MILRIHNPRTVKWEEPHDDITLKAGDEISIDTSPDSGIRITVTDNGTLKIVAKFRSEDEKPPPLSMVPN